MGGLVQELESALRRSGWVSTEPEDAAARPQPDRSEKPENRSPARPRNFVAALYEASLAADEVLASSYPLLVRSLSNNRLSRTTRGVWFTTMERASTASRRRASRRTGRRGSRASAADRRSAARDDNEFRSDLERELWDGDELTEQIRDAGAGDRSARAPSGAVSDRGLARRQDLRHVKRLYGIGGLSYGKSLARKDERRFWMSATASTSPASQVPGRDILLVSDYDSERGVIVLSVPPAIEPRRVSVDAIEHDDLPGSSKRRRDPARPCVDRRHPEHAVQLPLWQRGAGGQRF